MAKHRRATVGDIVMTGHGVGRVYSEDDSHVSVQFSGNHTRVFLRSRVLMAKPSEIAQSSLRHSNPELFRSTSR